MASKYIDRIINTPDDILRKVLVALCNAESDILDKATEYLNSINSLSEQANGSQTAGSSKKRKATSDIELCPRCHEAFYTDENTVKDCIYHPGRLFHSSRAIASSSSPSSTDMAP